MVNADVLVNSEGGGDGPGTNARASQVNYLCAPGLHTYMEEVYRFIEDKSTCNKKTLEQRN